MLDSLLTAIPVDLAASHGLLMLVFFLGTALLVGLCVPGVLIPLATTSGALIGPWAAAAMVGLGALAGSQLMFVATRRIAGDRVRAKVGKQLQWFEQRIATNGWWQIVALRLVGAPHFLVTGCSALLPVRSSAFAAATLVGMAPAIILASLAGSAVA